MEHDKLQEYMQQYPELKTMVDTRRFMIEEAINKINFEYQLYLRDELKKGLEKLGYTFEDDEDFIDFLSKRVTQVYFGEGEKGYFLDYVNESNMGTPILTLSWDTKIEMDATNIKVNSFTIIKKKE